MDVDSRYRRRDDRDQEGNDKVVLAHVPCLGLVDGGFLAGAAGASPSRSIDTNRPSTK
jgi:hypothetical protein